MVSEKRLATSSIGTGLLSMKQGKEQEANKTKDEKNIQLCNFIKNAFCVDGNVDMVLNDKLITSKIFFKCYDKKRKDFWVAWGELNDVKSASGEGEKE